MVEDFIPIPPPIDHGRNSRNSKEWKEYLDKCRAFNKAQDLRAEQTFYNRVLKRLRGKANV